LSVDPSGPYSGTVKTTLERLRPGVGESGSAQPGVAPGGGSM